MGLYEELFESFPEENVEPFGPCLIVPSQAFKPEWRERLQAEGVQVFSQAYNGRLCFFLRRKPLIQPISQTEVKPQGRNRVSKGWSVEDEKTLLKLKSEGLSWNEIAQQLGKSKHACLYKWKRLSLKAKTQSLNLNSEMNADSLKEFLEALNMLYPEHKRVVLFLLENAKEVLEHGS